MMYAGLRMFTRFLLLIAILTVTSSAHAQGVVSPGEQFSVARVIAIESERPDTFAGMHRTVQMLRLRVTSGTDAGHEWTVENGILEGQEKTMRYAVGDQVVVDALTKVDGSKEYVMRERYRLPALGWLTALFFVLVIITGGLTGIASFGGLLVSGLILLFYVVPQIVAGANPFLTCMIASVLIACTSLYLAHGFNRRTSVALLSTMIALVLAALLSYFFVWAAQIFGMGSEEAFLLQTGPLEGIDLRGLLLGGIIIGALGVLDDVTTAQTASVAEVAKANPRLTFRELYASGKSVGKEHIASLINTLALAYVGASLPLLLLFKTNDTWPFWVTLNSEFLSEEIIRTLVGSAALLFAVPISTWMAAYFFQGGAVGSGDMHAHHHA